MSKRGRGCSSLLKDFDHFGQPIRFTFKDKKAFNTVCGGVVSIFCGLFLLMLLFVRTSKLVTKDDPFFTSTTMARQYETVDLWKLGYNLAIEKIDPTVGRIEISKNSVSIEHGKKVELIELEGCDKVLSNANDADINYNAFKRHN